MTANLSDAFLWIAQHEPPVRPWKARPRRLAFTVAVCWLGIAGSIVAELLDKRGRR